MSEQDKRQLDFLTPEGNDAVQGTRVAMVGLGGLGAAVAQLLALTGIREFTLIDHDKLEETNRNRIPFCTKDDVGEHKVVLAERYIRSIRPDAKVTTVTEELSHADALKALESCDFVFCCVDHDASRMSTGKACAELGLPYMDLGSEIHGRDSFGGEVRCFLPGEHCLSCSGGLDAEEVSMGYEPGVSATPGRTYGQSDEKWPNGTPALAALNFSVASIAVMEFILDRSGIRGARSVLTYNGHVGHVLKSEHARRHEDCRICGVAADKKKD